MVHYSQQLTRRLINEKNYAVCLYAKTLKNAIKQLDSSGSKETQKGFEKFPGDKTGFSVWKSEQGWGDLRGGWRWDDTSSNIQVINV